MSIQEITTPFGCPIMTALCRRVLEHESAGCREMVNVLGFAEMPYGYALMLNSDRTHYYWLRDDGVEGPICVDRWMAYRRAKANSKGGGGNNGQDLCN